MTTPTPRPRPQRVLAPLDAVIWLAAALRDASERQYDVDTCKAKAERLLEAWRTAPPLCIEEPPTPRAVSEEDREAAINAFALHFAFGNPDVAPSFLSEASEMVNLAISHGWGPVAQLRDAVSSTLAELERLQTEAVESVGQDKGEDECESPSVCHAAAATFAYARAIRALKTTTGVTE